MGRESAKSRRKEIHLCIIDDFSRFTWTMFLRSKDETTEVLINFAKDDPDEAESQNRRDQVGQ